MEKVILSKGFGQEWSVCIQDANSVTVLEVFDSYGDACCYADTVRANLLESAAEAHYTAWAE